MILITGASGLIGRALCAKLASEGVDFTRFDVREDSSHDIRDSIAIQKALRNMRGVVHLAAVSRVQRAQQHPGLCQSTNIEGTRLIAHHALQGSKPWLIFASSREVYGNPVTLPVHEDEPILPINIYGQSKAQGESIIMAARRAGLIGNICRFSNVYGDTLDYKDRVTMAFARTAASGGVMTVRGPDTVFDFTHVDDVVDALWRLIVQTEEGRLLPPVHFVSGVGTSLRELAHLAESQSHYPVEVQEMGRSDFSVSGFVGDPSRAYRLLGWQATTLLADGVARLIRDLSFALERPQR